MRLVKYFCFFTIIVALLLGGALSLLIGFSDTEPLKWYILQKVGDAVGTTISTEHLNIQAFSSPQIQLSKLMFIDKTTGKSVFQLESGACNLELPLLMMGQVVIKQCTLNEPTITVRQQQDGSWQWLIIPDDEESDGTSIIQFAGLKELGIHNGTITITNESRPMESQSITLSSLESTITAESDFRKMNFRMSATPSNKQDSSEISVEGQIQGNFSGTSIDSKTHTPPSAIRHVTTKVNFRNIDMRPLLKFVNPALVISTPQLIGNLETTLSLFSDKTGYTLIAKDVSVRIQEFHILGKMSVTGVSSDQPAFFLTGEVLPYSIEQLTQLIPHTWIPTDIQSLLQQHTIRGNFDIPQVTIAGPLDLKEKPSILGSLRITQGFIKSHSNFPPLHHIQTSLTLAHDHLTINGFSAKYENSHIEEANGLLDLQHVDPWLTLTVNGDLQANDALKTAQQVDALKQDSPIWLETEHVEGHALIGLKIEGPLSGPGQLQVQQGEVVIENFGFQLPTQPFPIRAMTGQVRFNQDHLTINELSAEYGSSNIGQAHGRIEFRKRGPWLALTTNGNLHAEDILTTARHFAADQETPPAWLDIQNVQGDAAIALEIEGPLQDPKQLTIHQGELRVQNLGVQLTSSPLPLQGFSGHVNFDQDHVIIHGMKGKVGKSHTILKGRASFGQRDTLQDITLQSQVELSDLQLLFPELQQAKQLSGGPLEMAMSISGSTSQPDIHTELDLTSINVSYPHVLQKPSGISTRLTFDGTLTPNHKLNIRQSRLEIPPFHLDMKGEVSLDDQQMMNLTFTTGTEDKSIFPKGIIVGDKQLDLRRLEANVSLQGSGNNWPDWKTNGIIDINKSSSIATQTSNDTHQTARVQWTQENHAATLGIRAQDIPIESIIPENPKLSGNLSTNMSFEAELDDTQVRKTSVTGKGEFQIHNGHIVQSPVITSILSLLNIPNLLMGKVNLNQQGIPFNSLTGTFSFDHGLMTSNDLLLNSPVIKMTAAGTYEMPTDQLDFIFAVSPFGEYSNLLKNIPLFGRLLKGERKGLATALFEAKGTRQDPKVRYLPLESFTGGLQGVAQFAIDVLKNTVTLPKDLIMEPKEENGSAEK
ncbi:YhdP family protein [Candidatus Nitrospira salsa]